MRCAARLLLALLGTSLFSCGALAQAYPAKPLRLIVPDATSGSPDTRARILAQKLADSRSWQVIVDSRGWQVIVDNRPGAAGILAAGIAAQARPDGNPFSSN